FVLDHAGSNQVLCRFLRAKAMVRIGTVSYMFYLLHLLMIRIFTDWLSFAPSHWLLNRGLRLILSLGATLLLSELSWNYFESPILRLKSRFVPKLPRKPPEREGNVAGILPVAPAQIGA